MEEVKQAVLAAMEAANLTEKERQVLTYRFGIEPDDKIHGNGVRLLETVAKHFNVTRERIRQVEAKAFRKILDNSKREDFEQFRDLVQYLGYLQFVNALFFRYELEQPVHKQDCN